MPDEELTGEKENCSIEVLIGLQATKCLFAYDIIKENMDIGSLSPGDRSTIEELKTVKTLHRIQDCLTKLKEIIS